MASRYRFDSGDVHQASRWTDLGVDPAMVKGATVCGVYFKTYANVRGEEPLGKPTEDPLTCLLCIGGRDG